jgi:DNA invertase Pin-like site-specific DNA recombinase
MNTNKRKFIVGIYARISKDTLDSTNQLILLRNYCKSMDYAIYSEYVDVISGASSNKPEFNRMMQDASKRRIDMVLFFALDRFTREGTRKTIHYLQLLDDYGVMYKSYSEQYIDSSGIFRDVIIALLSTLAQQERLRISERVKAGLEKSRQQGRVGGRPTLDKPVISKIKELKMKGISIVDISKTLKISRGSVYQYI